MLTGRSSTRSGSVAGRDLAGIAGDVTVLQFAENLTDRQAADAVRGRIDWKYCLGLDLTDPGFDFSVLSQLRTRLVTHDLQGMAFEILKGATSG